MSESNANTGKPGERPRGVGGRRLADAFEVVSAMPALAEARRRLLAVCEKQSASAAEVADAVESDAALAIAVMRAASNGSGPPGRVFGIREAVEEIRVDCVRDLAASIETYDILEQAGSRSERHERFRRHAVAVRNVTDRIAGVARLGQRDELATAALLHDVGHVVIAELYGEERDAVVGAGSPDQRARAERRELGIDHALVGAVLVRRWGVCPPIAAAIERHHAADATGHPAAIRLADMIVHHVGGGPVSVDSLCEAAKALGIDEDALSSLLYEYPYGGERRPRPSEPCPLSAREIDALRGLAEGQVYKQIAQELTVSVSTVRTHLHNVYRKIGAVDRAQAVLIARDRGWL